VVELRHQPDLEEIGGLTRNNPFIFMLCCPLIQPFIYLFNYLYSFRKIFVGGWDFILHFKINLFIAQYLLHDYLFIYITNLNQFIYCRM